MPLAFKVSRRQKRFRVAPRRRLMNMPGDMLGMYTETALMEAGAAVDQYRQTHDQTDLFRALDAVNSAQEAVTALVSRETPGAIT